MRPKLLRLIVDLQQRATAGVKLAEEGSPVTSMAEDAAAGEVALEQLRILKILIKIVEDDPAVRPRKKY